MKRKHLKLTQKCGIGQFLSLSNIHSNNSTRNQSQDQSYSLKDCSIKLNFQL